MVVLVSAFAAVGIAAVVCTSTVDVLLGMVVEILSMVSKAHCKKKHLRIRVLILIYVYIGIGLPICTCHRH